MRYVNWQDPGTREIRSTDISGLQEIVSKLERSVGMETVSETDIPLTEVYISENDRWRIFQAPEGKRNWVSEPAPVIKRDGVPIDIGFVIDYGAGAIILATNDTKKHTYTADATYIKSLQTSLNEELATHLADLVTDSDGVHGLKIEQGIWTPYFFGNTTPGTPTYTVQNGYYYKINRLVLISGSITISAVGGMTGTLLLGGLPFAVSGNQAIGGISIGYKNTVNNYHFGFMPNTSRLQGYNGIDVVDSSEIPSNLSIQFTGVYLTN